MSEIIKFRVSADEKHKFIDAAQGAGMTLSDLLRRAGKAAVAGRIASRPILAAGSGPAEISAEIKSTAESLRAIAARHLTSRQ